MSVIQNQQTGLVYYIEIEGVEITEHNRSFNVTLNPSTAEVILASGKTKRFFKDPKRNFQLSFTFLPNSSDRTVDGRPGRDFLKNLFEQPGPLALKIKTSASDKPEEYEVFVASYREDLIRREVQFQASYFDVQIDMAEV